MLDWNLDSKSPLTIPQIQMILKDIENVKIALLKQLEHLQLGEHLQHLKDSLEIEMKKRGIDIPKTEESK